MARYLDEKDVDSLACAAMFLGSGGGGDPAIMHIMAKQAIHEYGPVRLLSPFELRDDDWAVTMSLMGSQAIHYEKIMNGNELMTALRVLENEHKCVANAITPLEIGGINAITPILASALANLPLVDCDAMGRAFPEFQMTTFHAFGAQASPFIMCADNGKCERIIHDSNIEIEKIARVTMTKMGGSVAAASFPMRAKILQEVAIPHTLLVCKRLGEAVLAAGSDIQRIFANLSHVLQNSIYGKPHKLIEGKVVDVQRHLKDGFLQGELLVEGSGFHRSEHVEVQFLSEYLLAKQGERIMATVPDILCVLDADSGLPVMIEELETHMKVWVIAIPCPILLRHPKMLDVVGPWNFGMADSYTPVEKLLKEETSHVSARN
ncbi:hypothetical protein AN963_07600 [Brevibacillus choshinensis]|uniref:DUF917 domain-containing protein n=1 Tax=Brevibacillus choshinensis TaxID=54911 RepID=A0ABR5NDH2_BRECH|nr:DUF917 domain-containing protein [Brevibacillus choshinensis]KQL49588.1 hypothetical protein AN963_07600 [Brevibacillus choshinensis]